MSISTMRILWIVDGVTGTESEGYRSALASNRYRAILPAQALREQGHQVIFIAPDSWHWRDGVLPDVVVVGKLLAAGEGERFHRVSRHVLSQIELALRAGVPVLADFNDDHFNHSVMGMYWRQLVRVATVCIAGSESMADLVNQHGARAVAVVGDPIGSPLADVRVFRTPRGLQKWGRKILPGAAVPRLKLVWYGNPVNWPAMQSWADMLAPLAQKQRFVLWVVTRPTPEIRAFVGTYNEKNAPAAIAELIEWDEQTQWEVVQDADIVLIPADVTDQRKSVKTSNRLVDALNAGRSVVASPLPSYRKFEGEVSLVDDPLAAVRWIVDHPNEAFARTARGQMAARAACGIDAVAESWERALQTGVNKTIDLSLLPDDSFFLQVSTIKLNLGCGDKILPGYINVDLAGNWSGRMPDVVADITDVLPFDDNYADEVHAYHVLEHLTRWKVEGCLREWVRVLKPGGKLVLEMPCLDKIIAIYAQHASIGKLPPPRLTIWALYGDPGYRVEAMMHQWCYSEAELTELLQKIGLRDVAVEPPLTHIAIRDMRQIGFKPIPPA